MIDTTNDEKKNEKNMLAVNVLKKIINGLRFLDVGIKGLECVR